jgi:hypothetical protein
LDRGEAERFGKTEIFRALLGRQVRDDEAPDPDLLGLAQELLHPVFKEDVVVGHEQEGDVVLRRHLRGKGEAVGNRGPVGEGVLVGLDDHGAVGHGLGKGDLEFDHVHPVFHHLADHLAVHRKGWVAKDHMGHEQDLFLCPGGPELLSELHIPLLFSG